MSDYLFAHPSFLSGASRTLDLGGVFDEYNEDVTPAEADARALKSDWAAVGGDIVGAMNSTSKDLSEEK
jgi:hypothetical protein